MYAPRLCRIRVDMLRAVKNKLPRGRYAMMATIYDRLGGVPLRWSQLNGPRWTGMVPFVSHWIGLDRIVFVFGWFGILVLIRFQFRFHRHNSVPSAAWRQVLRSGPLFRPEQKQSLLLFFFLHRPAFWTNSADFSYRFSWLVPARHCLVPPWCFYSSSTSSEARSPRYV